MCTYSPGLIAVIAVPTFLAWVISFAMFKRRVGGVYFAIITQAVALIPLRGAHGAGKTGPPGQPVIALASAGLANRFGHPAAATLTRLSMVGAAVYSTHQHGALRLNWQHGSWQVHSSRESRLAPWVEKTLFPAETVVPNR